SPSLQGASRMASGRTAIARRVAGGQVRRGGARQGTNVGEVERWLSLVGGGLLALDGLRRGSVAGLGEAALGGGPRFPGLPGHSPVHTPPGITRPPHGPAASVSAGRGFQVVRAVTIEKSADELYHFWRDFENLPRFMRHLKSVRVEGPRSHWEAKAPLGMTA